MKNYELRIMNYAKWLLHRLRYRITINEYTINVRACLFTLHELRIMPSG